jgi:hypothetical protein
MTIDRRLVFTVNTNSHLYSTRIPHIIPFKSLEFTLTACSAIQPGELMQQDL